MGLEWKAECGKAGAEYWPALGQASPGVREKEEEGEEENSPWSGWEWANPSDPYLGEEAARFSK